ncbi:MAG: sigma-70 family RNA polymerase sigma factor, partial [Negativicutes bacterium]|nr:sigma-70 family RNA polymerase sigma factor [Negativicutes bacterium]
EDQVVRQEMNECIRKSITFLPDNYRTIVILSDLEELKNSEIATILGLSIGTVKIRLHRAKEKLRKELSENCLFYRTECNELACEPKRPIP